jgi:hypothetical protein
MKEVLYIVQPIGYESKAKSFLVKALEEFKLLQDLEIRYSPFTSYLNYYEDLNKLNSRTSAKAEIIDTRGLFGIPIFGDQESRLLFSVDFFNSTEDEQKEIFLHEVGHYITNQSLNKIRRFIAINSPNYLVLTNKMNEGVCSEFNYGINYIVQLIKLSQELNAELWVYENFPKHSYTRFNNYCQSLDDFILTDINSINDKKIFFQLPFFWFSILFRKIVLSHIENDYSNDCEEKVTLATNKLFQIASKIGFRQMQMFKLKSSILDSLCYRNEKYDLQITNYISIFEDYIIKSLDFFPIYNHDTIKKQFDIKWVF